MSTQRPFKQVDVFTAVPYLGNPLAVVLDGDGLSDTQMQDVARWTNLSETTFVLAPADPAADYRVRIFTTDCEFPFAGHPTLGTAHALLEAGLQPKSPGLLVQECGVGLVPIRVSPDGALAFRSPPATFAPLDAALLPALATALGTRAIATSPPPTVVDMGIRWLLVRMDSANDCLAAQPETSAFATLIGQCGVTGVAMVGAHPGAEPADVEMRVMFFKQGQLAEDPVTGSANACLARLLQSEGFTGTGYRVRQGTQLQRDGRVTVSYVDGAPWIGGQTTTVIDGTIRA
jgi:PhzF family phenazine biosynthesis protein